MDFLVLLLNLYANLAPLLLVILWFYAVRAFIRWRTETLLWKGGKPDKILIDWVLFAFIKGTALIFLILIFVMFV